MQPTTVDEVVHPSIFRSEALCKCDFDQPHPHLWEQSKSCSLFKKSQQIHDVDQRSRCGIIFDRIGEVSPKERDLGGDGVSQDFTENGDGVSPEK
ncbi:hypothetical protein L6452_31173 [Arctium lappa]|uniref:Uncharacterized protein n=1 Tax=Arctium lappa TaxID=4217 RepID=A0ACB8ZJ69_ARCLA|nr:hypothetical protein L6452_31173 [Arctium lappa]